MPTSDFETTLNSAILRFRCRKLTLSRPVAGAPEGDKVIVRPIEWRGEPAYQFAVRIGAQERHENHTPESAARRARALFPASFADANLFSPDGDVMARRERDGRLTIRRQRPAAEAKSQDDANLEFGELSHDRAKTRWIPEGTPCPFLVEIGVMTAAGKVKADKQHKFRQINRFLDFVNDILPDLPATGTLRVIDFGCGKSSLTFAVHHFLTQGQRRDVQIVGLDRNPAVISSCQKTSFRLGCQGLDFQTGDIANHVTEGPVHLAISLHACDTASDFALAKAVEWQADAILAVPCCQHELAPQLQNDDLAPLLRHGILRERLATLATDALRAEWLAAAGYRTQVLEFIEMEHTPKNLLLRAVRKPQDAAAAARHRAAAQRMTQAFGVGQFTLADLLQGEVGRQTGERPASAG